MENVQLIIQTSLGGCSFLGYTKDLKYFTNNVVNGIRVASVEPTLTMNLLSKAVLEHFAITIIFKDGTIMSAIGDSIEFNNTTLDIGLSSKLLKV